MDLCTCVNILILMGLKGLRDGLMARQDTAQVSVLLNEVTPMIMNMNKSKEEGKEEQKEHPGACHHNRAVQEEHQHPLGLQ